MNRYILEEEDLIILNGKVTNGGKDSGKYDWEVLHGKAESLEA